MYQFIDSRDYGSQILLFKYLDKKDERGGSCRIFVPFDRISSIRLIDYELVEFVEIR
jgi:hypothetical protein